jgi:hypothetical protein
VMQGDVGRDVEVFGQMPAGLIQGPGSRVGPARSADPACPDRR